MKPKKYKNNSNERIVIVMDDKSAGMCRKTIGLTFVIYKYEDENSDYHLIMEHREFYNKFSKTI